jgi:hypothetical protein
MFTWAILNVYFVYSQIVPAAMGLSHNTAELIRDGLSFAKSLLPDPIRKFAMNSALNFGYQQTMAAVSSPRVREAVVRAINRNVSLPMVFPHHDLGHVYNAARGASVCESSTSTSIEKKRKVAVDEGVQQVRCLCV